MSVQEHWDETFRREDPGGYRVYIGIVLAAFVFAFSAVVLSIDFLVEIVKHL